MRPDDRVRCHRTRLASVRETAGGGAALLPAGRPPPTHRSDHLEEAPVASTRIAKKVEKLEKEADKLRKKAEKKGKELQSKASDRIDDLSKEEKGSKKGIVTLLLGLGAAGAAFVLKRKRDQELDEALWEEPRSI
jgi:hypothetical protein